MLSLDDDVRRWGPDLSDYDPRVPLRRPLHPTSGVRDRLTLEAIAGTDVGDVRDDLDGVEMIPRRGGCG